MFFLVTRQLRFVPLTPNLLDFSTKKFSGGGPDPGGSHQRGPPPSSSGSGRRSKFGPPAEGKNFLKASVYSAILMLRFTS